ncbi:MAG: sensor histidine kinase [Cytophagia bacterium]|nr:sensor histidine kinase [Cytophagia bacterium]
MALRKFLLIILSFVLFFQVEADQDNQELTEQEKVWMELILKADDYSMRSKYDSAIIIAQEIALAAEKENNYEFMTRAYLVMGAVHYRMNKIDLAAELYEKSRRSAEKWNNPSYIARADLGKGIVYERNATKMMDSESQDYDSIKALKLLDSALFYYQKTRRYYVENAPDNSLMLASVAQNFSANHYRRGQFLKAIEERRTAIKLYRAAGYEYYEIPSIYQLGHAFLKHYEQSTQYLDSAQKYLKSSYELGMDKGMDEMTMDASKDLAVVNRYLGNLENAFFFKSQTDSLAKGILESDYENRVLELRAQYQTATAELEAEKANSRSLRLERNRNITVIVALTVLILFSIWLYVLDQKRKTIKAIAAKNDELNKQRIDELLQQQEIASLQGVLEGQEQERKRVAIDLHDRLGGILSMVKLHFSAVEEKLPPDNPEKKKFLTASELLDLAAGEVRNISHNLLSGVLAKFGLLPALKDLTDRINESGEIKLNLIQYNVENALNGEQELQVYRIVQELISNILKHSEAKEATIQLIRNNDEKKVNLIVEDDGKGFDPSAPSLSGGIGLSNLKARVGKLNGQFHIDSGKGAGTSISIDIPIEDD